MLWILVMAFIFAVIADSVVPEAVGGSAFLAGAVFFGIIWFLTKPFRG